MPARRSAAVSDTDTADTMVNALLTASRLLVAVSARSLASVEESLTLPQFRMLVVLGTRGPMSLSRLAEGLGVQPSTAMRMIDRLAAAGMVVRGTTPEDRRTTVISLTKAGRRVVDEATERRRAEIAEIVAAMPEGQRDHLVAALRAFAEAGGEPPAEQGGQPPSLDW
jgi:DNA-binding MarR family transcriptional regulator